MLTDSDVEKDHRDTHGGEGEERHGLRRFPRSIGSFQTGEKECEIILGPEIIHVNGLVRFVPAVAYHFCLKLPATFSQPRTSINFGPSTMRIIYASDY